MGALLSCVPQAATSASPSSSAWSTTLPRQGSGNHQALPFVGGDIAFRLTTTMGLGHMLTERASFFQPAGRKSHDIRVCSARDSCIGSGSGNGLGHSPDVKISSDDSRVASPRSGTCAKDAQSSAPLGGDQAERPPASLEQGGAWADARRPRGRGAAQRRRARRAAQAM